jgi:hypothetical protein
MTEFYTLLERATNAAKIKNFGTLLETVSRLQRLSNMFIYLDAKDQILKRILRDPIHRKYFKSVVYTGKRFTHVCNRGLTIADMSIEAGILNPGTDGQISSNTGEFWQLGIDRAQNNLFPGSVLIIFLVWREWSLYPRKMPLC